MDNTKFEGEYLVILGWDGGEFDTYCCNSMNEVLTVLTKRVHEEIDWVTEDPGWEEMWDDPQEIKEVAERVRNTKMLSEDAVLYCYDNLFSDSWWFKVIDQSGDVQFEHTL